MNKTEEILNKIISSIQEELGGLCSFTKNKFGLPSYLIDWSKTYKNVGEIAFRQRVSEHELLTLISSDIISNQFINQVRKWESLDPRLTQERRSE